MKEGRQYNVGGKDSQNDQIRYDLDKCQDKKHGSSSKLQDKVGRYVACKKSISFLKADARSASLGGASSVKFSEGSIIKPNNSSCQDNNTELGQVSSRYHTVSSQGRSVSSSNNSSRNIGVYNEDVLSFFVPNRLAESKDMKDDEEMIFGGKDRKADTMAKKRMYR